MAQAEPFRVTITQAIESKVKITNQPLTSRCDVAWLHLQHASGPKPVRCSVHSFGILNSLLYPSAYLQTCLAINLQLPNDRQIKQQNLNHAYVHKYMRNKMCETYCAPSCTIALSSLGLSSICCQPSSMIKNRGGVPPSDKL